ncbi:MAG: 4Fe-4S ferredoxin [Elusimicrobia bacterium RIFOXYD2_FULL_34_15]|nr:MAG: 4Fe-4S ferredoxin [Elusimicrobia bacterium RIFOXYD2_FULL_34_15]
MSKRKIIKINEEKCNGCGLCTSNCPEGALRIVDGKAKLVGELLCDGLGACIGHCPENAIIIEEREAEKYNENKVMENIIKGGANLIEAHLKHLKEHSQTKYLSEALEFLKKKNMKIPDFEKNKSTEKCGCPGSMVMDLKEGKSKKSENREIGLESELINWPIQLKLINTSAPYFNNADVVITADCVPFSFPDFHNRFLKNKVLVVFCPKLDDEYEMYVDKLSEIFKNNNIKSITIVHMEVPCCFGTVNIVEDAVQKSGINTIIKEYTISVKGNLI